jgi:hypothetical protein
MLIIKINVNKYKNIILIYFERRNILKKKPLLYSKTYSE